MSGNKTLVSILALCAATATVATAGTAGTGTFSIVAYDAEAGEWGVAVASRVLAVGYIVPWAKAGVGAIATQAYANLDYGIDGLKLLEEAVPAEEVLARLRAADAENERRQVAIIDAAGNVAAFTGAETLAWSGNRSGPDYSVQGNILTGEDVLTEMERAYVETEGPLARRLVEALKAGEAAGGDSRGKESAALLVVRAGGGYQGKTDRFVDVRVDDNAEPVAELERIYGLWEERFLVYTYFDSGRERDLEYALPIMERVLAANPENADYYNNFAWTLASSKRMPAKALELALRAHELAPEDANIMDTLAEAHYAAGDFEQAITWEKKAMAANPDNEFFGKQLEKFEGAAAGE